MKDDTDMSHEDLIDLVRKIIHVDGSQEKIDYMLYRLRQYARAPGIQDYIYYPKPGDPQNPTIEQIVEKAIELRNANPTVFLMPPPKSPSKA